MSLFSENLPQWDNTGVEPSGAKKTAGWLFNEKPPAEWFNWLFNRTYACINELRTVVSNLCYQPGDLKFVAHTSVDTGFLKANGSAILISSYSALATKMYVGDGNNATAKWGYKCTNPANPNGTRSTAGTYIVLPDWRGQHLRGWADNGSLDSGRSIWDYQSDAVKNHVHPVTVTGANHTHPMPVSTAVAYGGDFAAGNNFTTTYNSGASGVLSMSGTTSNNTSGSTENLVANAAAMVLIKY